MLGSTSLVVNANLIPGFQTNWVYGGVTFTNQNSITIDPSTNRTFELIYVDLNGNCSYPELHMVTPSQGLNPTINQNIEACPGQQGVIVSVSNVPNGSQIQWTLATGLVPVTPLNQQSVEFNIPNPANFDYPISVFVTGPNGCNGGAATNLIEAPNCSNCNLSSQETIVNETCSANQTSDGSISVVIGSGLAPYTYNWSNGGSGPSISGLQAGSYVLTVIDSLMCQRSFEYFVGNDNNCGAGCNYTPQVEVNGCSVTTVSYTHLTLPTTPYV